MSDPYANTVTVRNILNHILSPKVVRDGNGGYITKVDLVNVDRVTFDAYGSTVGSSGTPNTSQVGTVTVASGGTFVDVYHSGVTSNSIIFTSVLNTNNRIGVYVYNVEATAGMFRIYYSAVQDTTFAWFIARF